MPDLFDADAMYGADYLHFFPPGDGDHVADPVWRLLDLQPGMRVLDVGCGPGALANALAARGCAVTGLDTSRVLLERARSDAAARGLQVDYVQGDQRDLPRSGGFDRVVSWSTAFGYFDDPTNREVLAGIHRVLRPGGRLGMDLDNLTTRLATLRPTRVLAGPGDDRLADRNRLDPLTGRLWVERTVVRAGRARQVTFVVRLFGYPEIRDWLRAAGFEDVSGHGEDGRPLAADHERMVLVARRP